MVLIPQFTKLGIPNLCPKCNGKLYHVNALDTKAKIYMVFCLNTNKRGKYVCKFCKEWRLNEFNNKLEEL